ncbi:MAG TPA: sugar MFS transporter [Candidatus Acidoferrum sp.]|jgi:FHS family L-fucose permease-like MFS transporter
MVNVATGSAPAASGSSGGQTYRAALAMVTMLFFFWGFVTVLNDILVPHLKSIFDLNYTKVMLIQFAFFSAYFIFSIPSAKVIDTIGYKKTMVAGLVTMGVGAFLFIPAASAPSFALFLGALMVLAAGITALQVAANAYVSVLGPPETASSRLNLTQAFNSLGTTIGPYLGGLFILNANASSSTAMQQMSADALQAYKIQEASSVKFPYTVIGIALIVFAVLIGMFKLPPMPEAEKHGLQGPGPSIWKYTHLVLGMVGIFVYVGAEVSIGSFLINYLSQPDIGNMTEIAAASLVGCYWGGAMVGRFVGSELLKELRTSQIIRSILIAVAFSIIGFLIPARFVGGRATGGVQILLGLLGLLRLLRPVFLLSVAVLAVVLVISLKRGGRFAIPTGSLLGICGTCAVALVVTSMLTTGGLAMWSIILVGFFNSIMFPSIFTLGVAKLGPLTGDGSGLMIMAIVGGAIIPVVQGAIADRVGVHHAFILPVLCYGFILYYGFRGSRPVVPASA